MRGAEQAIESEERQEEQEEQGMPSQHLSLRLCILSLLILPKTTLIFNNNGELLLLEEVLTADCGVSRSLSVIGWLAN